MSKTWRRWRMISASCWSSVSAEARAGRNDVSGGPLARAGPNAAHRVGTPSAGARSVGTARNWILQRPIKSFLPAQLDESFTYLDLGKDRSDGLRARIASYAKDLGVEDRVVSG